MLQILVGEVSSNCLADPKSLGTTGALKILLLQGNFSQRGQSSLPGLSVFSEEIYNGRVDAYVDNLNLINFCNNEGERNVSLSNETKELFLLILKLNIILNLHYVASKDNSAGSPSRVSSYLDCSLTNQAWRLVEAGFGLHTFNLMALSSNAMKSNSGERLTFSHLFVPQSLQVSMSSHRI